MDAPWRREIAFRSESRMDCYLGDEEATARAFVDDPLVTGDIGYRRGGLEELAAWARPWSSVPRELSGVSLGRLTDSHGGG